MAHTHYDDVLKKSVEEVFNKYATGDSKSLGHD
jgi:hypothetical protein